jgi:hypothetical protein
MRHWQKNVFWKELPELRKQEIKTRSSFELNTSPATRRLLDEIERPKTESVGLSEPGYLDEDFHKL